MMRSINLAQSYILYVAEVLKPLEDFLFTSRQYFPKLTKDIAIFFNEKEFASFKDIDKKDITVNEYQHILTRVEKKDIDMMIESNKESLDKQTDPPKKAEADQSTISIDDFMKIDLRVALIKEASFVEGADSLLKLTLDLNDGRPRQVFAGIKSKYKS
jgi:methionyl-tRNA synthetase